MLRAAIDVGAADWVAAGLRGFAESVLSVVPAGFAEYVRVFHPAYRRSGSEHTEVTWAQIARANGARMHAGVQIGSITGSERHERDGQPGVFDETPATGTLPANLLEALASVLERHTDTPDECLFAFWEGFAGMPPVVAGAPAFSVPGRRFHLLTGPLEAVHALTAFPRGQSPNLWWPRDRSWCVATEIDFKTTYIGADRACADQLTSTPGVEAFRVSPDTGIDWLSDALNRRPSTT